MRAPRSTPKAEQAQAENAVGVALPASLQHLAALLGPVLGGPADMPDKVDTALVALAIHRHQIGPLLHAALLRGPHRTAKALMQDLEACRIRCADRHTVNMARLCRIGEIFKAKNISWLSLKGAPQAGRLYGDPALRPSSDIDILVASSDFTGAVAALAESGYIPSNPPAPAGPFRNAVLAAMRDVSLIAANDHACAVDLHRRLFLAVGARMGRLRLVTEPGPLPIPRLDADLACYLIMHGAQSYWVRLKWLADLVPLFALLEDREKQILMFRAWQVGVGSSVAASLLLLRLLFPFVDFGPLSPWLDAQRHRRAVRARLLRYIEMIGMDNDWQLSPLDNARVTMEAYMSLFEAPSTRASLVPVALLSSAVRRTAGMIWRAERALTRDDRPPAERSGTPAVPRLH